MAREREVVSLGDICDFRAGTTFKPSFQGQLSGRYPFVKVSDMNLPANTVRIQDANNWVSEADVRELRAKPFPPKTVVFAKIGEALRQNRLRQVVRETIIDNNMMGAIPRGNRVDPDFFYYALSQFDFSDIAQGTALPYLTLPSLARLTLAIPCIDEQRAIARILGALDDKIELNRRMNQTLEAMARALFKSWFVDFDPVHAKAEGRDPGLPADIAALFPDSFEDSKLGETPKGWAARKLGEVLEFAYGKALKESDRRSGTVAVYGSNGQIGWHDEKLEAGPGIIVGRKGNPGIITWAPSAFFAIDTTFYVVPKPICPSLYFLFFLLQDVNLPLIGADSAVPGLNRNLAYLSAVSLPPLAVLNRFDQSVVVLFDRMDQSQHESHTLAALRDTLLPKLLSGELRVKDAETLIEGG